MAGVEVKWIALLLVPISWRHSSLFYEHKYLQKITIIIKGFYNVTVKFTEVESIFSIWIKCLKMGNGTGSMTSPATHWLMETTDQFGEHKQKQMANLKKKSFRQIESLKFNGWRRSSAQNVN